MTVDFVKKTAKHISVEAIEKAVEGTYAIARQIHYNNKVNGS